MGKAKTVELVRCPGCEAQASAAAKGDVDQCKLCMFLGRIGIQLCPDPKAYTESVWVKKQLHTDPEKASVESGFVHPAIAAAHRLGDKDKTRDVIFDLLGDLSG